MKRVTIIGLGFTLALTFLTGFSAKAQTSGSAQPQDQSSLGDYARKLHKDSGAAKPKPKVFDNDNIPKDEKISIVGAQPSANATEPEKASAAENKNAAPKTSPAEDEQAKKQAAWKQWQDKVGGQKEQIDLAGRELDVLQREYELRAAAMYADAGNRLRNSAQWDKQEAQYKQQIADKQKAVDDAKQKLQDMQEEARKAGVPSSMIE